MIVTCGNYLAITLNSKIVTNKFAQGSEFPEKKYTILLSDIFAIMVNA